jgi:ATP-dependent helicase HrpA
MGMDARVPRAQATAGMPEVEQRMEQLPDAQERPTSSGGSS